MPQQRPKWAYTPQAMTAPYRSKPRAEYRDFRVNEDPDRLDRVYVNILGGGGDRMLTEEVKWLAVTHKSFDHGRRGFNDRLAFFGKRTVDLQISSALVTSNPKSRPEPDQYGRMPFQHPALEGLEGLNQDSKERATDIKQLAGIAANSGLAGVLRWKPKKAENLKGSGEDLVLAQALYAIVGAIALQKGGEVANKIARDRILRPLGLA
ncbi:hypothetical protein MMC09_001107 [Bachmanniomyces sp. S44760]|nr:hypothetical protein [Bachmanniomyces sp. S44760]